jgi:hypothetical protein
MKEIVFMLVLLIISYFTIESYAQSRSVDYLYPIDSSPLGINFKEWPILWMKSYLEEYENKTTDINGNCYSIEYKSVIFLTSPFSIPRANYECSFTTSNSYFFPLFSEECDYESITGLENLKKCVLENNNFARGKVFINGTEIHNLSGYRFTTDMFKINFTSMNPYGATPGSYDALIDGLFVFIKPLPVGTHELKYSIVQIKPNHDNDYAAEITYKLHVTRD